jgi:peptidoglycan hydrolase-like protein with peptidoglycan-binding domain
MPAAAGTLHVRVWRGARLLVDRDAALVRLDTRRAVTYRIRVTATPAAGFTSRSGQLSAVVAEPNLRLGSRGSSVRALEQRLSDLHYALLRVDSSYGQDTYDAVVAFQKVSGLPRTGTVDRVLWRRLARAAVPRARHGGSHVEVDKTRQVLFEVRRGKVALIVPVSTGATGNTPVGVWHVYSRIAGWSWVLWYPTYFLRGFAIHGYPDVPPYPASHGCVRVPMWVATRLYAMDPYGFPVYIYA